MLKGLREEARIRWQWWRIYRETIQKLEQEGLTEKEIDTLLAPYDKGERRFLRSMTMRVEKQADWWAIDLPEPEEQPDWWSKPEKGVPHLTHKGIARAKKLIQGERRQSVGWWTDRVVSVLALLVALAAILSD